MDDNNNSERDYENYSPSPPLPQQTLGFQGGTGYSPRESGETSKQETVYGPPSQEYEFDPLDTGDIIDQSLIVIRDNAKEYGLLALVTLGPLFLIGMVMNFASIFLQFLGSKDIEAIFGIFMFIVVIPIWLISAAAWLIFSTSVPILTSEFLHGRKMTFQDSLKNVRNLAWPILKTLVPFYLGGMVLGIFGMLVFMGLVLLKNMIAAVLGFLFMLCLILIILYYYTSMILLPIVIVVENQEGFAALRRAYRLAHQSWNILSRVLTVPMLSGYLGQVIGSVPFLSIVLYFFAAPLPLVAATILYYDLRVRTEAYDIEQQIDKSLAQLYT